MGKDASTRVVLADDHKIIRQELRKMLGAVPDIEVVGEAQNGYEALRSVIEMKPDVLLLDIEMPQMNGIDVVRRLREMKSQVRVIILSSYDDSEYIHSLFDLGVTDYFLKGVDGKIIIEAIRSVG